MNIKHLIILGAGASAEYGLPTWNPLAELIRDEILLAPDGTYPFKEEMLQWIDRVGVDETKYSTIDLCISKLTHHDDYFETAPDIQDAIFRAMRKVCENMYKQDVKGWIAQLGIKILRNVTLDDSIAFVNYNYDYVLEKKYLQFEGVLNAANRKWFDYSRLSLVSRQKALAFHPHGSFYPLAAFEKDSHIIRDQKTIKSHDQTSLDAVSCYDADKHSVGIPGWSSEAITVYIMGVGGGLEQNLSKLSINNVVKEVHVTVHDPKLENSTLNFLKKKFPNAKDNIIAHRDCATLIENCF